MLINYRCQYFLNLLRSGIILLINLPAIGQAETPDITSEEYVKQIYIATSTAWPEIEKIWSTPAFRNIRLIIADSRDVWAVDSKSMTKIPYSEVKQRNLSVEYMHYKEIQWPDGRPTLYISMGSSLPEKEKSRFRSEKKPVPELFNVATHEAFHFFVQAASWKDEEQGVFTRATAYPVQPLPRLYRNNIIRALYASLLGDPDGLGHARYWSDLWGKRYSDEASNIRLTDVEEGSARYVEMAAEIIAQGIRFNTQEFQYALTEKIKDGASVVYTSADIESYTIGALAGFILNTQKSGWQQDVEQGIPPLEALLKDIQPIKERVDKELFVNIKSQVREINNTTGIDRFVRAYKYPGVIKIFIDQEISGSYEARGFFRTNDLPYDIMTGFSSSADWTYGNYSINKGIAAAINSEEPGYNGKNNILLLYAGQIPPNEDGRLILNTKNMSLNIPYPDNLENTRIIYLP
ncbi:hypothetical protein [Enterobacter cancerogenus]|uniref:hypothetical protein n=1 Tax=Enterobacter cancerogenus TaxID=69218 RepID=UPI0005385B27|nr:hypothetical protein [Enterobacter cancerogenus]KGT92699.1 hypothetical protein NH00_04905 [Enterobacter cancerogenus]